MLTRILAVIFLDGINKNGAVCKGCVQYEVR
jgi:hypothetical protein